MICQRSGCCCISMPVVIMGQRRSGELRALVKPGGVQCPHLSLDGKHATCTVHHRPEYVGSPCYRYGNPDEDPDFEPKRGRPCPVGKLHQISGRPHTVPRVQLSDLEDVGPWPWA